MNPNEKYLTCAKLKLLSGLILLLTPQSFAHQKNEESKRKSESTKTCSSAKTDLKSHINAQSKTCKQNDDCQSMYLNIDSCDLPYYLNKKYIPDEDKKLIALQNEARKYCAAQLTKNHLCEPSGEMPVCYRESCIPKSLLPR